MQVNSQGPSDPFSMFAGLDPFADSQEGFLDPTEEYHGNSQSDPYFGKGVEQNSSDLSSLGDLKSVGSTISPAKKKLKIDLVDEGGEAEVKGGEKKEGGKSLLERLGVPKLNGKKFGEKKDPFDIFNAGSGSSGSGSTGSGSYGSSWGSSGSSGKKDEY